MTRVTSYLSVLAVTLSATPLATLAVPLTDVEVRVIPLVAASPSDTRTVLPTATPSFAPGSAYVLEVWLSDVGSVNTGIVSAFLDVNYQTTWTQATAFHHSSMFRPFGTDPTLLNAAGGLVDELGGNTPGFLPQGIAPNWVRLGWIDMLAGNPSRPQSVQALASAGTWGIGVYDRLVGQIDAPAAQWTVTPEPMSAILAGIATVVVVPRRRLTRRLPS